MSPYQTADRDAGALPPRRRRIVYVIGSLDVGGAERHLAQVTPGLRRRGWSPTIYCLSHRGVQASTVEQAGVEVIAAPLPRLRAMRVRFTGLLLFFAGAAKLLGLLLVRRPAIAHFFLPGAYIVGGPLSLLTRTPVRIMSRRSLNDYQQGWAWAARLERWLHKRMTAILGNSKRVVDQLVALEGCPPERTHLIYNGIDLAPYDDRSTRRGMRERLLIAPDAFVAVLLANLIPYKGHADLIEALARIRGRLPRPWVVLCAGRDDGLLETLERQSASHGLSDHVRFLGARSDVPDLLAAADLGLLCSHQEGFSNAILEGMAAGLPMVVTDVGGNAEAVLDGQTGLVVPPRDPAALGAAIVRLALNPAYAKQMGAAGRQRAVQSYSLDRCVDDYDALYLGLTGSGAAGREA